MIARRPADEPRSVPALCLAIATATLACAGEDRGAGGIEAAGREPAAVRAADAERRAAAEALHGRSEVDETPVSRILFGDLHVHTTFSIDAFMFSLPFVAGEGAHPPADACDFARHCAQLDFFSLNDHAEGLTPEHWEETKRSLRECSERAGDSGAPDLVPFAGWEWTQVGPTPEEHYGHKNVMFPGLADDELPARPISSRPDSGDMRLFAGMELVRRTRFVDPLGYPEYADFLWLLDRLAALPLCEKGVDTRSLPRDCHENAPTPAALFEKLAQWGFPVHVIPHGTSWGFYTPPGARIDEQLSREQHDPERQRLVEIHSGHGNSEEYRSWRAFHVAEDGSRICPEPTPDYLPCCWRAGEIMRERCGDLSESECEARVEDARRLALEAQASPHLVFPDTRAEDWLDCGQCRDCFKPAFKTRPRESVQYAMSLSSFDEPEPDGRPQRFHWGFIASSDNHTARPGTGYKQYARRMMTEASGARSTLFMELGRRQILGTQDDPQRPQPARPETSGLAALDVERVTSFLYPGGLVGVHATSRSRDAIWDALDRREVYGTSGPRILLWFDLLNGPDGRVAMGGKTAQNATPRFEVRATGALVQKPGCPEESIGALSPERLERLCRGECYHPSDERHPISAIEIVRIRPQARPGESPDALIEDPWKRFPCPRDSRGCVVSFEDPEYRDSGRDVLYYARALQVETPAINADNLRTRFDAEGNPTAVEPCFGDVRTPFDEDCLAPIRERAWSSPIFLEHPAAGT